MKIKLQTIISVLAILLIISPFGKMNSQTTCKMGTLFADGFEYATVCPDIDTSKVIHSKPQAYVVHSGSKALYMNLKDSTKGLGKGTFAHDTVYRKQINVCKNTTLQISAWLRTYVSGNLCNMTLVILDGNNKVLDSYVTGSISYTTWLHYQSAKVTPTTATVKFVLITNIGGCTGNDLGFDDLLIEECSKGKNSTSRSLDTTVCADKTVMLTATAGFTNYTWSNKVNTQTNTVSSVGSKVDTVEYIVDMVDNASCIYTDTFTVNYKNCLPTSIIENKESNFVSIYPNPSTGTIFITKGLSCDDCYFTLNDISGKLLNKTKIISQKQEIKLNNISSGIYFYSVLNGEILIKTNKLIIE